MARCGGWQRSQCEGQDDGPGTRHRHGGEDSGRSVLLDVHTIRRSGHSSAAIQRFGGRVTRVLVAAGLNGDGGAERYAVDLASRPLTPGVDVRLLCVKSKLPAPLERMLRDRGADWISGPQLGPRPFQIATAWVQALAACRPHVVLFWDEVPPMKLIRMIRRILSGAVQEGVAHRLCRPGVQGE